MYSETYQKARKEFINCLCMSVIGVGFPLVNAFGYWLPIMREEKAQTRDTGKVTLPAKEIEQFFPKSYTPAQKKKVIVKLLASWARQRGEQVR